MTGDHRELGAERGSGGEGEEQKQQARLVGLAAWQTPFFEE